MELRTTSFAFIRTTLWGAIGIGDVSEQQLHRDAPLLAGQLLERREREHLRELVVVDADDAEIARNLNSEPACGDDRSDRHLVAGRDDGGRPASGVAERVDRRRVAAGKGHIRRDVRRVIGEPGIRHRGTVAVESTAIDLRPVPVGPAADERDAAVAECHEVLGRAPRGVVVIDRDDRGGVARAHDVDDGATESDEAVDFVVVRLEADRDEAVEPLARQEVLEDAGAPVRCRAPHRRA